MDLERNRNHSPCGTLSDVDGWVVEQLLGKRRGVVPDQVASASREWEGLACYAPDWSFTGV